MVSSASVGFAFISILKFCMVLKLHIASRSPLAKIIAFKIIVGLTFIENVRPLPASLQKWRIDANSHALGRILAPLRLAQVELNSKTRIL